MEKFSGILDHFMANIPVWEEYCNATEPHNTPLPAPWNTKFNAFEVIIWLHKGEFLLTQS